MLYILDIFAALFLLSLVYAWYLYLKVKEMGEIQKEVAKENPSKKGDIDAMVYKMLERSNRERNRR